MVDAINKIIRNTLLKGGAGVVLPDVGRLRIVNHPAARNSRKTIIPPHKTVVMDNSTDGISIVDEIVRFDVDAKLANEAYNVWREQSFKDGILTVSGVGTAKNGVFKTDREFMRILNPQGTTPVAIKPRTDKFFFMFASLCCVFALCIGGYIWINNRNSEERIKTGTPAPKSEQQNTTAAKAVAEDAEKPVVQPVVEPVTEMQTSEQEQQQAQEQPQQPDNNAVLRSTSGRSYLVLGIFSTEDNARRAIADAVQRYPAADCRIYHYSEKFMVSLFEGNNSECVKYQRSVEDTFPGLWIYTKR